MIPFTHPAQKIDKVDGENKDMGQSYMIREKVIKNLQLQLGSNQVVQGVNEMSQVQIPNQDRCIFDELVLIHFVSQGLTLSTASLVCF